jgi:hypothetical protein
VTPPSHDLQFDLGAYVLGALTPEERDVIDAHLGSCPTCTAEMDEMSRLPVLLDLLPEDEVAAMGTGADRPPADLVERVVAAAVAERRGQRRRRWLVSVAAAAVLIAGSSAAAVAVSSSGSTHRDQGIALSATNKSTGTWAKIDVAPKQWGASLDLTLTGVPPGEHCKLVAVGRDGTTDVAGSWEVTYAGRATLTGATSLQLASTVSYDIVTFSGQKLLSVPTA